MIVEGGGFYVSDTTHETKHLHQLNFLFRSNEQDHSKTAIKIKEKQPMGYESEKKRQHFLVVMTKQNPSQLAFMLFLSLNPPLSSLQTS